MPKVKENEKVISFKVPTELKNEIKMQALKEQTTVQELIIRVIKDYCRSNDEDELIIEPVTEEDLPIIERGRQEYARGEYQDFDEMIEELENESNSNEGS